jgi:hypothetical protein
MKIRMSRAYGQFKVGDVHEMPDGQASLWLSLGYATIERAAEEIETATIEHRTERADVQRKPRGKK